MCIDLGFHRLPPLTSPNDDNARKHKVLWYLYTMETGIALTLGRTKSLHLYDIATEHPSPDIGVGVPGIPGKIYAAFFDMAILAGEIQPQLFSVAAEKLPRHIRGQRIGEFRTRLEQIQAQFNRVSAGQLYVAWSALLISGRSATTLPRSLHSVRLPSC